jgi:hypothetical protein
MGTDTRAEGTLERARSVTFAAVITYDQIVRYSASPRKRKLF